ncbi:hypothetical protein FCH31_19725 [Lelliottia amnigena]|nr:hypothetical protein [Lelliottia amnigena]
MQYSFFVVKSASDQSVGGEKSPSEDGLKVSTATKIFSRFSRRNGVGRLCSPQSHRYLCAWGCMRGILPLTSCRLVATRNPPSIYFLRVFLKRCSTARTQPGVESCVRGRSLRYAGRCKHRLHRQ